MRNMNKQTHNTQVLLGDVELEALHKIILTEALVDGKRPVTMSAYLRKIIRADIKKKKSLIETQIDIKTLVDK